MACSRTHPSQWLLLVFAAPAAAALAAPAPTPAAAAATATFQIKTAIVRARLDRPFICIQSCSSKQKRNPTDGSSKQCATICNVRLLLAGLENAQYSHNQESLA